MAGGTDQQRSDLATSMAAHGYAAETAADASAALSALVMHAPDAVVLCDTPAFDAREVCRRLRTHAGSRRTPVALLLAPGTPVPLGPAAIDADLLPGDGDVADLLAWADARLPPEATAADWLRLTLAQAPDSAAAEPAGPAHAAWHPLLDHLDDGVAVVEHEGRVRRAHAALARLLEQPSAEACLDRHLLDLLPASIAVAPAD
ncbi:MAG: PAS domain-containing protein, partial [Acidobacteria bacterium]|nr:PAS domain-containing protein [Acidobacteriota bacterium]